MQTPLPNRPRDRRGFTLIELTLVGLVIAILLGLILNLGRHAVESADRARALSDLAELHRAVESYHSVFSCYPEPVPYTSDALPVTNVWDQREDADRPAWQDGTYTNKTLRSFLPDDFTGLDPWNAPYWYRHDATNAPDTYLLYSTGPNTNDINARIFHSL